MAQTGFISAMAAELTIGKYEGPNQVAGTRFEWIIVSTWGGENEFLSLALTASDVGDLACAPDGLQPSATYLGILLGKSMTADDKAMEYLLVRNRPTHVPVGGVFHPSDGYVRIVRDGDSASLTARGRFAHCQGNWRGETVVRDVPDPAPGAEHAKAWHLTAQKRPWIGEFPVPAAAGGQPLARPGRAFHTVRRRRTGGM